jgi:hypothetical protein
MMTNKPNNDSGPHKSEFLPFAPGDLDRSGIRLTRAEFARFLDVSRQSVGEWVASGKITLGPDKRLDPRQAVSQLMRNADPERLRSKVLAPLVKEIGSYTSKIAELERNLADALDDSEFHEGSSLEMLNRERVLFERLHSERSQLEKISSEKLIDALITWMGEAFFSSNANLDLPIFDCVPNSNNDQDKPPTGARPEIQKEGGE